MKTIQKRVLPIGVQSFEKIRRHQFLYVDKTKFIYDLAANSGAYFLARPRRFGKSLLTTTMEAYFSGKKDLFNGLKISELEEEGPTGVTKFSHVSIFSDLNQLKDISMMPDYNEICGLTMDEIAENFYPEISDLASEDGLTVEEEKKKLAEWYDGYLFADEGKGIFNPFSVLNVLADKKYKNYWFGTGTPTFLIRTLKRTGYDIRLLEKGTEQKAEAFTNYFADSNSPIPLFYQSGYLTIKGYDKTFDVYKLGLPNREVKYSLFNSLPSVIST